VVDALVEDFRGRDHDMRGLILGLVTSDRFALRRELRVVAP
jgi:hypothetical protein